MSKLSHTDAAGAAHMVDVAAKTVTYRRAVAEASVVMRPETMQQIKDNAIRKGDVLATARIAGIMAAKKTHDLIPLCHPLPITSVKVSFTYVSDTILHIKAEAKVMGQTGVEMEALTAASIAALTIYDMAKAIDKDMQITDVHLLSKEGGKSGRYERTTERTS